MFIGRVPTKYLAMLVFVGVLFGALAIKFGVRGETARHRIESFIEGSELPFQAKHARIAVATGGLVGKGPGNSDQRNILPHPYSDFVYAIIIEEYGMFGGIVVLALYLLLLHRGMKASYNSERAFGGLLCRVVFRLDVPGHGEYGRGCRAWANYGSAVAAGVHG